MPDDDVAERHTRLVVVEHRLPFGGRQVRDEHPVDDQIQHGDENPRRSDAHPAKYPSAGWSSSDRNRYSPPDRGTHAATVAYARAPASAMIAPTTHAASTVPGPMSCTMKPALMNTPAPTMFATTSPTPDPRPSSRRSCAIGPR